MLNCSVDQGPLVANRMQDLSMQGVTVGKAPVVVVVVLVGVFSQSHLLKSETKVCKLENTLIDKLYELLRLRWGWCR